MAILNKKEEITDLRIRSQVSQPEPWLVMCNGVKKERQTFFSISKGRSYARNIPELANKKILSNWREWLVLDDNKTYSLLNIISMEKVELPKYNNDCTCCILSCSPEDPNCHVVFIDMMGQKISICRPGDDKHKVRLFDRDNILFYSATCLDGSIYLISFPSLSLIRASLNDTTLEFQTVINGESVQKELLHDSCLHYLIESCGELLMVSRSILHENSSIFHVFRADFSTSKWLLLKSIGDRTIFLEALSTQGISCASSESGIQENCIYYMSEMKRSLYIFNLEDQSFTVTIPCPTIDLINFSPHWIMIGSPDKCVL